MHPNAPYMMSKRSNKSVFLKSSLIILMVLAIYTAWSIGRLRAEDTPKRNFTYTTQEDMSQIKNLHDRAANMIARHEFKDAINVYSEAVLIEPDDEEAYTQMGQCYMVLGYLKRAKDAFRNALDINPDNEIASMALRKLSDPDFSEETIKETHPPVVTEISAPVSIPVSVQKSIPTSSAVTATVPAPISSNIRSILDSSLSFNQLTQLALQNAGLYRGSIDGTMNESVQKAIETFQMKNHLQVDGMAGPSTWSKLKVYLDKKS